MDISIKDLKMPELRFGTPKQIAWETKIRTQELTAVLTKLSQINNWSSDKKLARDDISVRELYTLLEWYRIIESAVCWIDMFNGCFEVHPMGFTGPFDGKMVNTGGDEYTLQKLTPEGWITVEPDDTNHEGCD